MQIASDMTQLIGNTPMVELSRISQGKKARLVAKCEFMNLNGSSKDRTSLAMIEAADRDGALQPGMTIIEPTSGNTGIGLAGIAAVKGYSFLALMPETMTAERRIVLRALGTNLLLTPGEKGIAGAITQVEAIVAAEPTKYFIPQQFTNPANPRSHCQQTAREVWEQTEGKVDYLICGVGTGGHHRHRRRIKGVQARNKGGRRRTRFGVGFARLPLLRPTPDSGHWGGLRSRHAELRHTGRVPERDGRGGNPHDSSPCESGGHSGGYQQRRGGVGGVAGGGAGREYRQNARGGPS